MLISEKTTRSISFFLSLFFASKEEYPIVRQLVNRSLRAETLLGPDVTRLEQNAQARLKSLYKHAGQLVYENVKKETDLKI